MLLRQRSSSGSVTLMAIVVMVVLAIVVTTYLWIGQSTSRMLHHTYFNEKVLAIFEALDVIARSQVQTETTLGTLLENEEGTPVDITSQVSGQMDQFGLLGEAEGQLSQKFKDALKIEASLKGLSAMPGFASIRPPKVDKDKLPKALRKFETPEVKGRVAIRIRLSENIALQTGRRQKASGEWVEQTIFSIPKRDVSMEYEFKRARIVPPFFRHFSLWMKSGGTQQERPEDYGINGNFNYSVNGLNGKKSLYSGGVVFVKNAQTGTMFNPNKPGGGDFTGKSMAGRFEKDLGYIYIGGDKKYHLNLMAGDFADDAIYSETFHLYRGATTDFYKVWSTEFSNFVEKAQVTQPGKDAPVKDKERGYFERAWETIKETYNKISEMVVGALKRVLELDKLEEGQKNAEASNALPLYYVVRKDYGYAKEWGDKEYQRFGFAAGGDQGGVAKIVSSSLHLYGANTPGDDHLGIEQPGGKPHSGQYLSDPKGMATPTVVLGNVYRRCLSLSGYKQRRKADLGSGEGASTDRKFEVQAGPIEYFPEYNDLMGHTQDPRNEKERKPIWVWDARVKWNIDPDAPGGGEGNGTYIPISGAGLFGRLIPGLAKLWEGDKADLAAKLFKNTVAPPEETSNAKQLLYGKPGDATADLTDVNQGAPMAAVGLSPLFVILAQSDFFSGSKYAPGDGYLFNGVTPYFEELMRCFCFTVSGLGDPKDAIKTIENEASRTGQSAPSGQMLTAMEKAIKGGKERWIQMMEDQGGFKSKYVTTMKAEEIKDTKMKAYWAPDNSNPGGAGSASGAPPPEVFPWSLPDPWDNQNPPKQSANKNFRKEFENWVKGWPVSKANTPADFYKFYFYPLMTNPARVQPYNQSLRFICTDMKEIFSLDPAARKSLLMDEFPPEVTDGMGYIEKGVNSDYLDPAQYNELNDMPLNDAVLENIHKKRTGGDKRLQRGYFFMDEYGTATNPGAADTKDIFKDRSFWQDGKGGGGGGQGDSEGTMTWEQATQRFMASGPDGKILFLNTMLGLSDGSIDLGKDGPISINGGGAILVADTITIHDDIRASKPVFLVADKIVVSNKARVIQASLVAHNTLDLCNNIRETVYVFGNVVCGSMTINNFSQTGHRVIAYNEALKDLDGTDKFVTNIEPRIRKFSSDN